MAHLLGQILLRPALIVAAPVAVSWALLYKAPDEKPDFRSDI